MSDPRWDDPRDRDEDSRELRSIGSNSDAQEYLIPATTTLGTATRMFANAAGSRVTTIYAMCFSTGWNYRADSNARSSSMVIIGTS